MNEIIVYSKVENEKVLIGTFESTENIYEEVEERLVSLNLTHLMSKKNRIYISMGFNEYRMIWGEQKSQVNVDVSKELSY